MNNSLRSPMAGIAFAVLLFFGGLQFGRSEASRLWQDGGGIAVDGGELILRSLNTLESLDGLEVELRQEVDLFDAHLIGDGRYLQRGQQGEFNRIDMVYSAGGEKVADIQQIDNGRFLLSRFRTPSRSQLARVDLDHARGELGFEPVGFGSSQIGPGAGLLALMRSFQREFEFSRPRQEDWQGQVVWVVVGRWKPSQLKMRFGIDAADDANEANLPAVPLPFPTHVEIVMGNDDQLPFFPYRIDFLRNRAEGSEIRSTRIGRLEMHQIRHRVIPEEIEFQLPPSDEVVTDDTAAFVARYRELGTTTR